MGVTKSGHDLVTALLSFCAQLAQCFVSAVYFYLYVQLVLEKSFGNVGASIMLGCMQAYTLLKAYLLILLYPEDD